MSYPVQEYHPLVIDTAYMYDYVTIHGNITDLDTFEKVFGFSLYDFCKAVLSGNFVNINRDTVVDGYLYDTVRINPGSNSSSTSELLAYKGSSDSATYGGITISFSHISEDNYGVEYLSKYIVDNFIEMTLLEI